MSLLATSLFLKKLMDSKFYHKVSYISIILCTLVIWVHSYNADLFLAGYDHSLYWQSLLSTAIGQIAVPGFFMLSALLFFRDFDLTLTLTKWYRRFFTLVIPFCLWNILYYIGYQLLILISSISDISVMKSLYIPRDVQGILEIIFLYKFNPICWFMFQLILLVIVSPLIYILLKNAYIAGIYIFLLICFLWLQPTTGWDIPWLNEDALFYYSLGGYFIMHHTKGVCGVSSMGSKICGICMLMISLAILILRDFIGLGGIPTEVVSALNMPLASVILRCTSSIGLWLSIDKKNKVSSPRIARLCFFVYMIHFIFVRGINKIGAELLYGSISAASILFVLMPIIVFVLASMIANFMDRHMNLLYRILAGDRV